MIISFEIEKDLLGEDRCSSKAGLIPSTDPSLGGVGRDLLEGFVGPRQARGAEEIFPPKEQGKSLADYVNRMTSESRKRKEPSMGLGSRIGVSKDRKGRRPGKRSRDSWQRQGPHRGCDERGVSSPAGTGNHYPDPQQVTSPRDE